MSVPVLVHHPKIKVRQESWTHQYLRLDSYDFKARDPRVSETGKLQHFWDRASVRRVREYKELLARLERNIW